ncbi:MAG: hypothetical protein ACKVY0_26900 [Prosthecobacter sp.]|uniref:hypothetical protein n=1 Tax=Prosthecobacter sp. TaxID=1965333 RepID=UPI0038FDBDC8
MPSPTTTFVPSSLQANCRSSRRSTAVPGAGWLAGLLLFTLSLTVAQGQITSAENLGLNLGQNTLLAPQAQSAPPAISVFDANPGPWGKLQCTYVFLEAPKSLIEGFSLPSPIPRWSFPESSLASLPELFAKAGLSKSLIAALLSPTTQVKEGTHVHLFPPLAELEAITQESRAVIYGELAKDPANEYHADPVLIIGTTVEEWYKGSKLRPELIAKIQKLSYMRGETIAFSDIPALLNYAQSDSEARTIFKACTRTRTLMVRMKLDRTSNAEQIINYWTVGAGLRRKDLEPLINSIVEIDGIDDLGLVHVLPALVRKLLYTYPGLDMAKYGIMPDCHWTSLNFFNFEPHQYLLDARLATSQVLEQFTPVEPPYQYGDILFFLDNTTGDAYHSCVHLADNIVYTKNGRNLLSPWLLMRLEDVKKVYLYKGNGRVQGFRRKDIAAQKSVKEGE